MEPYLGWRKTPLRGSAAGSRLVFEERTNLGEEKRPCEATQQALGLFLRKCQFSGGKNAPARQRSKAQRLVEVIFGLKWIAMAPFGLKLCQPIYLDALILNMISICTDSLISDRIQAKKGRRWRRNIKKK